LELLDEGRKEAEQQRVCTEKSKDPTLLQAGKQEREKDHERVRAAAPGTDKDERGGVQHPGVQGQVAPISVNRWQGRGSGASAPPPSPS